MVRIVITQAGTKISYDVQMSLPRLQVQADYHYGVNFMARADSPRSIGCGFAKGHAPWSNLGWYHEVQLTSQWQSFEESFVATEDENNARIHFDVGVSDIAVEVSSVTLRRLSDGAYVYPEVPATQCGQLGSGQTLAEPAIPLGEVHFGSLRRCTPLSQDFGCDRGRPIDRYYIENFLARHGTDVRGRVLEIGESSYTRRFGGARVTISEILHMVEGDPEATIIADLTNADHILSDTFDCFILTQTLQFIYDVRAAVKTIYRILKPGGVLLATFPGISQTYDHEWGGSWCWNFTSGSARQLFHEVFPAENVKIETFGNVLAAISFLHGLAVEELTQEELDYRDPGYEVTITVRAVKPESSDAVPRVDKTSQAVRYLGTSSNSKALILMYHRVAEGFSDPWSLCVSPQRFAQQLEVLRKHTEIMPLQGLVEAVDRDVIARPTVAVTFDDGYADNLYNAQPLLERYGIPATVFVTTGYLSNAHEFWWDELDRILLQPGRLPEVLRLTVNGLAHQWNLGEAAAYTEESWHRHLTWRVPQPPPCARHALFVSLWKLLQLLPKNEQRKVLDELLVWAGVDAGVRPSHCTLSPQEVVALKRKGLLEIGAHTVTHPILSDLPTDIQREEIQQSKSDLEELLGSSITSFAYPYGACTVATLPLLQEAGFTRACSTFASVVQRDSDRFQLPRLEVKDWNAEEFSCRLSRWLA